MGTLRHVEKISLSAVLPRVFAGSEGEPRLRDSEIWLNEVLFEKGKFYLVEAESGTGKSSLCSFIYGTRRDYLGHILFDGADISSFGIGEWCGLRRESLAYLPQELELFPELSAVDNVLVKNRLTGFRSVKEITAMLDRLELGNHLGRPVSQLSVGQQQRVAIVRALCQPFDFLIIDEPVSHLDARNNRQVAQLITEEARLQGAGVIATSVGNTISLASDFKFLL